MDILIFSLSPDAAIDVAGRQAENLNGCQLEFLFCPAEKLTPIVVTFRRGLRTFREARLTALQASSVMRFIEQSLVSLSTKNHRTDKDENTTQAAD